MGALLVILLLAAAAASSSADSPACPFAGSPDHHDHDHDHHHDHDHDYHHHDGNVHHGHEIGRRKLPEELAEEDLALLGFCHRHDHEHHHHEHGDRDLELSPFALWAQAMGCSLLVSTASLVCLIILPVIFFQGKPSKAMVDALAMFGAGAMLGDAFLHQLPHAFGGENSHSHSHADSHGHDHHVEQGHSHSHSLKDLSVGLSILSGIVLFLLVEKVVRYVEALSGKQDHGLGHGHHHHHKLHQKLEDDANHCEDASAAKSDLKSRDTSDVTSDGKLECEPQTNLNDVKHAEQEALLRKRVTSHVVSGDEGNGLVVANGSDMMKPTSSQSTAHSPSSLVFGYLNLFSDGVHNFTDGMALGSAFLLYGSVGGWSRTLFLLAHELPQEIGDFGILVRSGFTVFKALCFNFLSALVALAGTALALVLGTDPGHSSLIEGFTAGGFIYIAVAGVLPEMNNGITTVKSTTIQLTSLISGMAVALCISLVE